MTSPARKCRRWQQRNADHAPEEGPERPGKRRTIFGRVLRRLFGRSPQQEPLPLTDGRIRAEKGMCWVHNIPLEAWSGGEKVIVQVARYALCVARNDKEATVLFWSIDDLLFGRAMWSVYEVADGLVPEGAQVIADINAHNLHAMVKSMKAATAAGEG